MKPYSWFEAHHRPAQSLIAIYRLLAADEGPVSDGPRVDRLRALLDSDQVEELIVLENDRFFAAVREHADLRRSFFLRENLALLLRQAVVAACTALDVYYPALLREHLGTVIQVRGRNLIPDSPAVGQFMREFRLNLVDHMRITFDDDPQAALQQRLIDYFGRRTLSNSTGLEVVLRVLGVTDPWNDIAHIVGEPRKSTLSKLNDIVSRRNDIVHRGDRPPGDVDGDPQTIDVAWTQAHVSAVETIALASDQLVGQSMAVLAGTAVAGVG